MYRPSGKINYFRVVPADDIQGEVAAMWAKELGVKKVFILHDRELYGKGVADVFKRACGKLGIEIVGYEGIDPKAANYRSLVTKIKSTAPNWSISGDDADDAGQIAKDLVSVRREGEVYVARWHPRTGVYRSGGQGRAGWTRLCDLWRVAPEQLKGKGREFYENYKKKFSAEPEAYAVYGYESGRVVSEAIQSRGQQGPRSHHRRRPRPEGFRRRPRQMVLRPKR